MAHRAILHLGTLNGVNDYEILKMEYSFNQNLNIGPVHGTLEQIGNHIKALGAWTTGEVTGGVIKLTMATLPNSDTIIHRWMFSRWRPMDGRITVDMNSGGNVRRELTIVFAGGYCTKLTDSFDSQMGKVMTTSIEITCETITIGTNIPAIWPAFV